MPPPEISHPGHVLPLSRPSSGPGITEDRLVEEEVKKVKSGDDWTEIFPFLSKTIKGKLKENIVVVLNIKS